MSAVTDNLTLNQSSFRGDGWLILAGTFAACWLLSAGIDVVLLLLSLMILFTAIGIIKQQAGGYVVTPTSLFLLFFIVFTYIGGIQLFFSNGNSTVYTGGYRNWVFYLAMHLGLIGIVIGNILASIGAGFKPAAELARFRNKRWTDSHNDSADFIVIILAGIIALGMTIIYISNRGVMPLFEILGQQENKNVYELAIAARAQFSRYGAGASTYFYQGYFLQFYVVIFPLVVMFFAVKFLHYRTAIYKWAWILGSFIACVLLAMSLQRWPLMFFIILNYIVYSSYKSAIRYRETFAFAALALILFGFLTYIRGLEDIEMVVDWVVNRIVFTQVEVFYSIAEMFPKHFEFRGGFSLLGDVKGVLPGPDASFNSWLFDEFYRAHGNGTAPTIYWGQLYADLGLAGVLAGGIAGGFIMQWIYIKHIRGRKRLINLIIYSFITMACGELAVTVPVVVLFQFGVVTVLLYFLLHELARNILKTTRENRLQYYKRIVRP